MARWRSAGGSFLLAALAAAAALLVALPAAAQTPETQARPCLVVSSQDGTELAVLELPEGRFDHVFVHSFHLTPVQERFRVESDGAGGAVLRLYELRYQSTGVGMPEGEELGYRLEDGVFILRMDRSFASIPLRVSPVKGHGIEIDGKFWPFTQWVAPGRGLVLTGRYGLNPSFGGSGR